MAVLAEQKGSAKGVETMDLVSLVEELKRQKLNSFDIIAEDDDMAVFPNEDLGILVGVCNHGMWPLTEWVHTQLAEKTGVSKKYYERMCEVSSSNEV